ncbi:MAG: cytochrome c-type biogenesis protein CcmH [SAR324 cluster bacterium]|nr:cytochrome c-type biogenesis protein CcmH [SAR324 cluster bacterium]MCZ6533930.1 cytochrome c-type biogenesis protein CcmH [SAR324 cluster bacterium]MCZ6628145.1 cytochrome c-type biogenesis protein CcmH [SAR324 cluster bacterium]MCZ6645654.1 cytochrome c-type biogenesis protein CcmH [SAR324 cluster bacterium]
MSSKRITAAMLAGGFLLPLLFAIPAGALTDQEALEKKVRGITDQLRCPTCQGISVNDSEAAFSRQIRDKVKRMVREGQSEDQIKAYFESRYGEWILRAPKKEGLGLVLWVLPGLLMLLAGGWIVYTVRRNARVNGKDAASEAEQPLSKAELERIKRDVRLFEEEL